MNAFAFEIIGLSRSSIDFIQMINGNNKICRYIKVLEKENSFTWICQKSTDRMTLLSTIVPQNDTMINIYEMETFI